MLFRFFKKIKKSTKKICNNLNYFDLFAYFNNYLFHYQYVRRRWNFQKKFHEAVVKCCQSLNPSLDYTCREAFKNKFYFKKMFFKSKLLMNVFFSFDYCATKKNSRIVEEIVELAMFVLWLHSVICECCFSFDEFSVQWSYRNEFKLTNKKLKKYFSVFWYSVWTFNSSMRFYYALLFLQGVQYAGKLIQNEFYWKIAFFSF